MFRSKLFVSALSVACLVSAQAVLVPSAVASPFHFKSAGAPGVKLVHLSLKNNGTEALRVKLGETEMTVQAGKTVPLALVAGTRIVNLDAVKNHAAGELLNVVSTDIAGATITIN